MTGVLYMLLPFMCWVAIVQLECQWMERNSHERRKREEKKTLENVSLVAFDSADPDSAKKHNTGEFMHQPKRSPRFNSAA